VLDLERELEVKNGELDDLVRKMGLLEAEKTSLSEQISALTSISEVSKGEDNESSIALSSQGLEREVVELRRLNKELQLEKRNLACRLASVESQLASVAKASEVLSATVLSNGYIWWPITLSVWLLRKC
jgi:chromosome segregation ATPase